MNYLFIGGPADGSRIALTGHLPQVFRIPTSTVNHGKGSLLLDHTDYRLFRLAADEKHQHIVYVHESLTPDDAIYRLITGYNGFGEIKIDDRT